MLVFSSSEYIFKNVGIPNSEKHCHPRSFHGPWICAQKEKFYSQA